MGDRLILERNMAKGRSGSILHGKSVEISSDWRGTFTKWITTRPGRKAIYDHVKMTKDKDGEEEMVIETTGRRGYMDTLEKIFREGRVYGQKETDREKLKETEKALNETLTKKLEEMKETQEAWVKNQEDGEQLDYLLRLKHEADDVLLQQHQNFRQIEDTWVKEINGDVVEFIIETLAEEEEEEGLKNKPETPKHSSTPKKERRDSRSKSKEKGSGFKRTRSKSKERGSKHDQARGR